MRDRMHYNMKYSIQRDNKQKDTINETTDPNPKPTTERTRFAPQHGTEEVYS